MICDWLFQAFNWSGKCPLWHASSPGNIPGAFVLSEKCPSGMCLVGETSIRYLSRRGNVHRECVWLGKCLSEMWLVGEMSVGDVSIGVISFGEVSGPCFIFLPFSKMPFITERLIYLKIVYVENRSFLCHHTLFEYHISFEIFLIFRLI